ncbi:MAG: hypothetical protein GY832_17040 [Chloroflexi bacterium]|nr:hypothetical protein [Chloroflexota bacterium]
MEQKTRNSHKLNIFALPNQATILLSLIMVSFWSVLVESTRFQAFIVPLALGILILSLLTFLAWPERQLRKHNLCRAGDEFIDLASVIEQESKAIGLPRVPKLVIGEGGISLYSFGSLRHWYIAISRSEARRLQDDLADLFRTSAVHAMILHELYHFKNGDYWKAGYTRDLLGTAFRLMGWATVFLIGCDIFLLTIKDAVLELDLLDYVNQLGALPSQIQALYPSVEELAILQTKIAALDLNSLSYVVFDTIFPFIVLGGILPLLWRKSLRAAEFYADAGVAHTQKNIDSLCYAFILVSRAMPYTGKVLGVSLWNKIKSRIREIVKQVRSALTPPTFVRKLFSTHPEFKRRLEALEDPTRAYDHWLVTALSLGGLALILDILLATPLTLSYQGQWPMHFSVLVVSVVVTLTLMTPLVLGKPIWKLMLKIIGVVIALRFIWLTLTIGLMVVLLILAPDLLVALFDSAIVSIARYTPYDGPIVQDLTSFVIEASLLNTAQVFIVLISLILLIGSNIWLLRRLFTWYSFPQNKRKQQLVRVAYGVVAVTTTSFSLSILTPTITALFGFEDMSFFIVSLVAALGFVMAAVGLSLFLYANRKYAKRCPKCDAHMPGFYYLGKRCETCDELLHPWLIAEYEL